MNLREIVLDQYLPRYLKNIQEELRKAGEDPDRFSANMVRDIVVDVMQKVDEYEKDSL